MVFSASTSFTLLQSRHTDAFNTSHTHEEISEIIAIKLARCTLFQSSGPLHDAPQCAQQSRANNLELLPTKRTSLEEGHLPLYLAAVALVVHQHFEVAWGQQETWKVEEHRCRVRARLHTS